eukprot:1147499-Pelagomonas_calceolata.AAC.6
MRGAGGPPMGGGRVRRGSKRSSIFTTVWCACGGSTCQARRPWKSDLIQSGQKHVCFGASPSHEPGLLRGAAK